MTSTWISPSFTSSFTFRLIYTALFLVLKYLVGNSKGILGFSHPKHKSLPIPVSVSSQTLVLPFNHLLMSKLSNLWVFYLLIIPCLIHQQDKVLWTLNPWLLPTSALSSLTPEAIILWLSYFLPASVFSFHSFWSAWRLTETFQSPHIPQQRTASLKM